MDEAHEEFEKAGAEVVAIFQYRAEPTANFCRRRGVDHITCLGDPERQAYHAVGLERWGPKEVVGPQLAKGFLRAARHGAFPGVPKGDTAQRPGTFVVSPEGKVVYAHYHKDSADNPPVEDLLTAVRGAG